MKNEKERVMKKQSLYWMMVAAVVALTMFGFGGLAAAQDESAAKAGEKTGVEGQFVRVAETDEGWVVLGYGIANESVKEEWMLLNVGMTVLRGVKGQKITRDDIYLVTPDHKNIPLPTQKAYEEASGSLRALNMRANIDTESINYFPPGANQPCRIGFFADAAQPGQRIAYDQVELNSQRACLGRLYFHVPGGIQYGNYNLDVQFANSVVRVPMKIMTKEEAKEFEQQWKEESKKNKHKGHDH
jgi:hypothetical protein